MRRLLIPIFICIIFTLPSCEGETKIIKIVKNDSSTDLLLEATIYNEPYDITIESGEKRAFYVTRLGLGATGEEQDPSEGISEFTLINSAGDTCTKDYIIPNNWQKEIKHTKKHPSVYDHYYTFGITDSDF